MKLLHGRFFDPTAFVIACFVGANASAADLSLVVAQDATLQLVVDGCKFTEGPAADPHGNVYFTDQPNDRIIKISTNGTVTDFLKPAGRSNGMFFNAAGKLITCADEHNQMWEVDPANGQQQTLFSEYQGQPLNGPNDVWVHPSDVMFFTDPFYKRPWWDHSEPPQDRQALYRVSDGGKTIVRVADEFKQPNGIVGDAARAILYVADIGDKKTYRYPINADATLGERVLFCSAGSDGMTLDDAGNVYLTGKGVSVYQPDGTLLGIIEVPENWTANVCFGGVDHQTLFITASDSVYSLSMRTTGLSNGLSQ